MAFGIQVAAALLALGLTNCSSAAQVNPGASQKSTPILVDVKLYPPVGEGGGEEPTPKEVKNLVLSSHCLFHKRLDVSHGIAINECSPQPKHSLGYKVVERYKQRGQASFDNSLQLDFVPPSFYHRVGSICWYLVKRDTSGNVIHVVPQKQTLLFSDFHYRNLLPLASSGDEMAGFWTF